MRYLFDRIMRPEADLRRKAANRFEYLKEEVRRELSRITSQQNYFYGLEDTRSPGISQLPDTVLNFGIPDITSMSANATSILQIAERIKAVILRNEPRLIDPIVEIIPRTDPMSNAVIAINAQLSFDQKLHPFHMLISGEE